MIRYKTTAGPPEYDLDCAVCYPAGLTPRYQTVLWFDVPNVPTEMVMEQKVGTPCEYFGAAAPNWSATLWIAAAGQSRLHLLEGLAVRFDDTTLNPCDQDFVDGAMSARVFPTPGPTPDWLTDLMEDLNLVPADTLWFAFEDIDLDTRMVRFSQVKDGTNVHVELDI